MIKVFVYQSLVIAKVLFHLKIVKTQTWGGAWARWLDIAKLRAVSSPNRSFHKYEVFLEIGTLVNDLGCRLRTFVAH